MEPSILARHIAAALGPRVEALARLRAWATPDVDPTAPIPVEQLCWAIAANPGVRQAVTAAMAKLDEADRTDAVRAITAPGAITDAALTTILDIAQTRLAQYRTGVGGG